MGVVGWGINSHAELGIGSTDDQPSPVPIGVTKAGSKASLPISGTALLIIAAACALASLAFMVTRSRRRLTGAQRGPRQAWATPAAPPEGWQGHTTAGAPMRRPIAPGARPADPPRGA